MAGRGRPRKEINWNEFDKLCGLQCTLAEIASFFDCSEDTIERAVQREHEMNFADYFKIKSGYGKISLRRKQFKLADKSAAMAIFLGKQYLGQTDKVEAQIDIEDLTPLAEMLKYDESKPDDSMETVQPETQEIYT